MSTTKLETVEFDAAFLERWNQFCDGKGYVKRHAAHAARVTFMNLTAEQREQLMQEAMQDVVKKRGK